MCGPRMHLGICLWFWSCLCEVWAQAFCNFRSCVYWFYLTQLRSVAPPSMMWLNRQTSYFCTSIHWKIIVLQNPSFFKAPTVQSFKSTRNSAEIIRNSGVSSFSWTDEDRGSEDGIATMAKAQARWGREGEFVCWALSPERFCGCCCCCCCCCRCCL